MGTYRVPPGGGTCSTPFEIHHNPFSEVEPVFLSCSINISILDGLCYFMNDFSYYVLPFSCFADILASKLISPTNIVSTLETILIGFNCDSFLSSHILFMISPQLLKLSVFPLPNFLV